MHRRLFAAALGLSIVSPVLAQEARPAVRVAGVRAADDAILPVRAQMPDAARPSVIESRGLPAPGAIPPPLIPVTTVTPSGTVITGGPVAGVTMGPAVPMASMPMVTVPTVAAPAEMGLFGGPVCDQPLLVGPGPALPAAGGGQCWFNAEYLSWWTQGQDLPTLVTTGPAASNGILGQPGTTTLFGGGRGDQVRGNGARFTLGHWFGSNQCWGLDGSYFFLDPKTETFTANSGTFPLLARPFTNLNQNIPFSQLTSYPGVASGGVRISQDRDFWGADINLRKRWSGLLPGGRLDALIGFRYLNFDESLVIAESFQRTPNSPASIGVPNAVSGVVTDSFKTTNDFYGVQLGLQGERRWGRWYVNGTAKVGLGQMYETATIAGSQVLTFTNGATGATPGGLLALPNANIGTFRQNKFAAVPEGTVNLGYNLTPHWRVFVGYNFLYLSNVLRPADQIDTGLDVTRIPNFPVTGVTRLPTVRPAVPLKETSVYTHGINFGTSWTW